MVGVFFPANGKFYAMGGACPTSVAASSLTPFEYDPVANSWTTKVGDLPRPALNNMACGVLTTLERLTSTALVVRNFANPTTSDRVFRYDPVTDTITVVAAPWPAGCERFCPVASQSSTTSSISWVDSTPSRTGGKRPTRSGSLLRPGGLGAEDCCPACSARLHTHDDHRQPHLHRWWQRYHSPPALSPILQTHLFITRWQILLHDSCIPRATAETRALNFCNQMYVMGGGRNAPNPQRGGHLRSSVE